VFLNSLSGGDAFDVPDDDRLRARRSCGCRKIALPDIVHWWRFTRLRLLCRTIRGWREYLRILWLSRRCQWANRIMRDEIILIAVGLGLVDPSDGLSEIRESGQREKRCKEWEKKQLFLGADSDHPDGVYARNGNDLVCMTSEEFEHWHG